MFNILFTCEEQLHDRIISLNVAHKSSLTSPLVIEVAVPSLESDPSCILLLPLFRILRLDFVNVSDSVVVFVFLLDFRTVLTVW